MAMLAGRFRVQRAFDPPSEGVDEKLPAIAAKVEAFEVQSLQFRFGGLYRGFFTAVFGSAVGGSEQGKDLEILSFLRT
jgi:hypothetical protein